MWNSLLVILSLSAPVDSVPLLFAVQLSRHGARAPSRVFPFHKELWADYQPGQLTAVGQRQSYLLGVEARRKYVYDTQLVNGTYTAAEVWIQSTNVDRAVESAVSMCTGLFPPQTGPKVRRRLRPPLAVRDVERIEAELGESALPFRVRPVPVHADERDHVLHGYEGHVCPRMTQIRETLKQTPEYAKLEGRAEELLREMRCLVHDSGLITAKRLYSALTCDSAQGFPLPSGVDLSSLRSLYTDTVLLPYRDHEVQVLTCSEFFKQLLQHIDDRLADGELRLALYTAHDYTLVGMMMCMGVDVTEIPQFAATLEFELYADLSVLVLYNGKVLGSEACPRGRCELATLRTYLQRFIVQDISLACAPH